MTPDEISLWTQVFVAQASITSLDAVRAADAAHWANEAVKRFRKAKAGFLEATPGASEVNWDRGKL